jgi:hypothetical protein
MEYDLKLRRKWTFRTQGKQIVLVKKRYEKSVHVLMKGFIWALYLPHYPNLTVELSVDDRYKPDVVAFNQQGMVEFWGEAGQITVEKIHSLLRRYRSTHFAIAKWRSSLNPLIDVVKAGLEGLKRSRPVDLINFQEKDAERFIDEKGNITIDHRFLDWVRLQ